MAKVLKKGGKKKPTKVASQWSARLAKMKKHWTGAREAKDEGFTNLSPGKYIVRIVKAEITESQNGRLQIHWDHKVVQGDDAGSHQHSWDGLESPDNLVWLARKLGRLQKETPEEIEEIEQVLAEIAEEQPVVRITVRENGEFTNVYLDKLMDESELELEEDEETEDENEEEETEEEETEDEGETEEDEDENEEEEEGDVSYEDIMEMKQKDLISLIKENKLKTKTNMPINTMRKKVCEELGLEPSEEETEEETEEVEEEVEIKKGSKVIFLHKGKTTEAKVLSIDGDTLKVKTKDGTVIKVPAAKCEADDTPF